MFWNSFNLLNKFSLLGTVRVMSYNARLRRFALLLIILLITTFPLFSQPTLTPEAQSEDPFSFIGMRLSEMVSRFGAPRSVSVARGDEPFQDDVVFAYDAFDFFVFHDRVWKVGLRSFFGLRTGDARAAALLVLGESARGAGDYLLHNIPGGVWPVSLRVDFSGDRISSIFIFRPDFH